VTEASVSPCHLIFWLLPLKKSFLLLLKQSGRVLVIYVVLPRGWPVPAPGWGWGSVGAGFPAAARCVVGAVLQQTPI